MALLSGGDVATTMLGALPVLVMVGVSLASWAFMARRSLVTRWEAAALVVAYVSMLPFIAR